MNKVLDHLYIGGVYDLRTPQVLDKAGITRIYKLYEDKEGYPELPSWCSVRNIPVNDGAGWTVDWLAKTVAEIERDIQEGHKVLVMCAAGRSRSATVTLAYLATYGGMTLKNAWFHLKVCRPVVDPHIELLVVLYRFLGCQYLSNMLGE